MPEFRTLTEALDHVAATSTRRITHVRSADEALEVSFADLRTRALGVLGHLQRVGLRPGDELVLMLERTEAFVDVLWACLYGGIVPVPLAAGATDEHRRKLFEVLERLDRPAVVSARKTYERVAAFAESEGRSEVLAKMQSRLLRIEDVRVVDAGEVHPARPEDLAFVQFSSGSTQSPKGVMLTHRNVLANIEAILEASRATDEDVGLSWMPLTHDMGLVGFHLTPVVGNISHVLIPTELFIRRPMLWLRKISELGATITGAPNFGYAHLLRVFDPKKTEGLDLSRLRLIFNGAEPISARLARRFTDTLAPLGLAPGAMFPVYGLAEATVAVTAPAAGAGLSEVVLDRDALEVGAPVRTVAADDPRGLSMVMHGGPVAHCELRLVDGDDASVDRGALGHVQIRGRNVTCGFRGAPERFAAARTADGWVRTGDLGVLLDGELVLAGRAKDVIFVHGQNVYPQDLEWSLSGLEGAETGRVVALAAPGDDRDEVIVFVLHRGDVSAFAPLAKAARRTVSERMGVEVDHVLPTRRFPKTTSGKVQRHKLLEAYRAGEYAEAVAALTVAPSGAAEAAPLAQDELAAQLKAIVDRVMPEARIGLDDNIFEVGTSSLTLAQIFEEIDGVWPDMMEATDFFDYPTINEVAAYLKTRLGDPQS